MKPHNERRSIYSFSPGLLYSLLIAVLATISACADPGSTPLQPDPDTKPLLTSVFYRERIMLPPGSIVSVTLEDVSRMDVKAVTVSKAEIAASGSPPYQVTLNYPAAAIKEKMTYSLRAQIHNEGRLLFTSTERINPFKQHNTDEIPILVQKVTGSQAAEHANSSLIDTYWNLEMLLGNTVEIGSEEKVLFMVLESQQSRVHGFSGCNNFSGSFTVQGNSLHFGQLISTQMMCIEAMEQEFSFLQTLSTSERFEIHGEVLSIFNANGDVIAQFTARPM